MAVVEDRVVGAVCLLDLVEALRDQEALDLVASHEGQRRLEEVEPAFRRELVEHHEHLVAPGRRSEILGQPPPDLIEHEPDQRPGA